MRPQFPQDFVIAHKWPAQHPERIQLYSLGTPNGLKVTVALEEMGLPYESHTVNFETQDQFSPEFLSIAPNNKIPAIIDPQGPSGQAITLFESGAILLYLAEKTGQFLSTEPKLRYQTLQWLMWQMGGLGPMFGQVGFFHKYAGKDWEDKRPLGRYVAESQRLLSVLNQQVQGQDWVLGTDYSIADMAIWPWVRNVLTHYQASELLEIERYPEVQRVLAAFMQRPAVQRSYPSGR